MLAGHLDRPELRLRHAKILGLPARRLTVQFGAPEQPCSLTCVVSHWAKRPREHVQQCPQEMLNGITTRSPGLTMTTPIGSWPSTSPLSRYMPRTAHG